MGLITRYEVCIYIFLVVPENTFKLKERLKETYWYVGITNARYSVDVVMSILHTFNTILH